MIKTFDNGTTGSAMELDEPASGPANDEIEAHPVDEASVDTALDTSILISYREFQEEDQPDLVQELVEMYLAEAPVRLAALERALAEGDVELLTRTAHSLKGASATLGARQVATLSAALETAGRARALNQVGPLLAQLHEAIAHVRQVLAHEFGSSAAGSPG